MMSSLLIRRSQEERLTDLSHLYWSLAFAEVRPWQT